VFEGQEIEQMNQHRRLTALFVILALVGCAQVATGQGHAGRVLFA
jgi:hypothetical protein